MFWLKFFVFAIFVLTNCTAKQAIRELSEEEDLELERQLKIINKSPVKTVKTDYGDIYDCIDFYKQPAFDNELLKNHTFHPEMKPIKVNRPEKRSRYDNETEHVPLPRVGCPRGTVPIRRTTKEDLIRQKHFDQIFDSNIHPQTDSEPGLHYAGGRIRPEWIQKNIGGGEAHFALYQTPFVKQLQFSSGLIKISNGVDFIKAGWTVNPTLYGDNRCRFFTYLHTSKQHCFNTKCHGFVLTNPQTPLDHAFKRVSRTGVQTIELTIHIHRTSKQHCFNTKCHGFVLTNPQTPLDHAFKRVSRTGVQTIELTIHIHRDPSNGSWWLSIGKGDKEEGVGFWPDNIFTDLKHNAEDVFWGGEIFTLPFIESSPMGNGLNVVAVDPTLYAYARDVSILDVDKQNKVVGVVGANEVVSNIGWDYVKQNSWLVSRYWGRTIMFGGPQRIFGK